MTASKAGIVERLRHDGRLVEALALVLRRAAVVTDKTTAINCLDPAHDDRHASAVVEPQNGRVTCKGCGRTWGLLELGVLRAIGPDVASVAMFLEATFYGSARRSGGTGTPPRHRNPSPSGVDAEVSVPEPVEESPSKDDPAAFPFVPDDLVLSLGWKLAVERGRKVISAPIYDAQLEVCGVKVRGPRRADGSHHAFLRPCRTGRQQRGLLHAEGLVDLGPGALVLVLAGETDLLAFLEAARRERVHVVAVSPSNGEMQDFKDVAAAFRGLRVVFIYDADTAGKSGALDRCWELRDAAEKAAALALPFTEEQTASGMKDVRDFLAANGTAAQLVDLAKGALDGKGVVVEDPKSPVATKATIASPPPAPWAPFPTDALPDPLRALVEEGAAAIGCDPSFIALPALVVVAAVIGNTRTILLKKGWAEVCVIWTAIVGESGTHKSPAMDVALAALRRHDDEAQAEHAEDRRLYKTARQRYEVEFSAWKKDGGSGEPPDEPEAPKAKRFIVVDATVEAIARILSENPRGVVLVRDELSGWIKSFDAYRGGLGGDAAFYLAAHGARQHTVDRKGDPSTIHVPRAAVSITGGIQPGTLADCIGKQHADDGLLARLLFALPPRTVAKWTTAIVDDLTRAAFAKVIADLLALDLPIDEEGTPAPRTLPLSAEAQAAWITFYDRFCERQAGAVGNEASALAKLVAYAARFALVHQLVRDPLATEIDAAAVLSGARLSEWFADEAVRVYGVLVESPEQTQRRRLVEWIAGRGGRVTVRELSHGPREYRNKEVAEAALAELVAAGVGVFHEKKSGEKGGRPTRVFVLNPSGGTGTETSDSSLEDEGFRCQDGVLEPLTAASDTTATEAM
jgi:hypothetical protein